MAKRDSLNEIAVRHGKDRWRDALFIGAAVVLTALALGTLTSNDLALPQETEIQGKVEVQYSNFEISR